MPGHDAPRRKRHTRVRILASASLVLVAYLLVFAGFPRPFAQMSPAQIAWLAAAVIIAFSTVVVCVWNYIDQRRQSRRRLAVLCQKCGFSLAELPQYRNGLVICPECGAPWHPTWVRSDDEPDTTS